METVSTNGALEVPRRTIP